MLGPGALTKMPSMPSSGAKPGGISTMGGAMARRSAQ
jgi:hypothetical protein